MKLISFLLALTLVGFSATAKERVFIGSTPAHPTVRQFLQISLTDSIDFIRWKLVIRHNGYQLSCQYGLSKAGTNGFMNGKKVEFSDTLTREDHYYYLKRKNKTLSLLELNANLMHLLDENHSMLVGDGGFSYTLNRNTPRKTDQFNLYVKQTVAKSPVVFEGRTPCQPMSQLLGIPRSPECYKVKWYLLLYTDSITGKPTHYLKGGTGYRKETMEKGQWQIIRGKDGRTIYKLDPPKQAWSYYLLKADENILLFVDPEGNLLVGNEDFSYTLNRREKEHPVTR